MAKQLRKRQQRLETRRRDWDKMMDGTDLKRSRAFRKPGSMKK